jgi:hypothetical protein
VQSTDAISAEKDKKMATISFGPGNSVTLPITHTSEISDAVYQILGASKDNTEVVLNGSTYAGELHDNDNVVLRTRANSKAA